jgi:serine-type D-Ala-D-Ala carboxypeptidase/endopeptidase (penicillin-binding protein 4)
MIPPEKPMSRRAARAANQRAQDGTAQDAGDATQRLELPATEAFSLPPAAPTHTTEFVPGFDAPTPSGFLAGLFTRHPRAWAATALSVVFVLLGTGSVFAGSLVGSGTPAEVHRAAPLVVASASPTPTADPARPVPANPAAATPLRTCSVASLAADPRLRTFEGVVVNTATGDVLFDRSASKPAPTASVLKVLTAAAALAILGPDARLTTKVYKGTEPGSIVLVGGGDPTLNAGSTTVYDGAPTLADLAAQTKAAWEKNGEQPITKIVLDATMWDPADNWNASWGERALADGDQTRVNALMVDAGRLDPSHGSSKRSATPVADAGAAFAKALGLAPGTEVVPGTGAAGEPIAQVQSQPVKTLIGQMLIDSDNTLGEMLARVTSVSSGAGGTSASLATVIPKALAAYGIPTTGIVIRDGSGLSPDNAVPPAYVAALMTKVLSGKQNLGLIYSALPVAGKTGTLKTRFSGASAAARGLVNAKTGWIGSSRPLAGIAHSPDGSALSFAFFALGTNVAANAMTALDTLTAGILKCGNNLSNN